MLLGFFACHRRGRLRSARVARRRVALAGHDRLAGVARGGVPHEQPAVRRVRLRRAARHGVPADCRRRSTARDSSIGRPYFDRMTGADRLGVVVPDGGRAGAAVAQGEHGCVAGSAVGAGVGRAASRSWCSWASACATCRRCSRSRSARSRAAAALRQLVLAARAARRCRCVVVPWRVGPSQRRHGRAPRRRGHRGRLRGLDVVRATRRVPAQAGSSPPTLSGHRVTYLGIQDGRAPEPHLASKRRFGSTTTRSTRRR